MPAVTFDKLDKWDSLLKLWFFERTEYMKMWVLTEKMYYVLSKKIVAVWETILMIAVSKLVGSNNQYTPVCFLYQNQYKINKWLWCNLFARS